MDSRPNVFLLSVDSLRADAFERAAAALAEATGGTRFRTAVAPACHTASSIPALATGSFVDSGGGGPPLPERFRADGYETVLLTDNPLVAPAVGEATDRRTDGWLRLDERLPRAATGAAERAYFRAWPWLRRSGLLAPYYRSAGELGERASSAVEAADTPVFCWVHYMDPHHPYEPPAVADGIDAASDGADRGGSGRGAALAPGEYRTAARSRRLAVEGAGSAAGADLAAIRALYERTCDGVGYAVETLVERLERSGAFDPERDVLAVTADHGECLDPQRGVFGHVPPASWESLIRVPLVVARPDWSVDAVDDQVSLLDLPTMVQPDGEREPSSFARRHAVTVAETLGEAGTVRGVRRADGEKLFGRRTAEGTAVVRTTVEGDEPGDPPTERVQWVRQPDAAVDDPLAAPLADRGGPVGDGPGRGGFDESQLRALGYLE